MDVSNPLKAAELLSAYFISKGGNEVEFNSIVAESLKKLKKDVENQSWLRRFQAFAPNMLVTTNWDDQLEKIFDGIANVVIRKDKCPQVSNSGRNILKIHGDLSRPDSIVITQSQYFSFQREDTYLNRKIYTLFSEASPVFIGYSLTDPNIGFIYDEVYAHLGEEKPPAYMVVHPTVSDHVLQESKLLFENKNIHIIKADIETFLKDLASDYKEFKNSTKRFLIEHSIIKERSSTLITKIVTKKPIERETVLETFSTVESRHQAISALVEILNNQVLFKEFGGELLSPENRISYREIDRITESIIWMTNESGYTSPEVKNKFYSSIMKLCSKSDGVWDFDRAERPFLNVLRISPKPVHDIYEDRIKHIIEILKWSAPREIGKCWGTWKVFSQYTSWLSELDIQHILNVLEHDEVLDYQKSDKRWLLKIKESENCSESQKAIIDRLTET
ncbi:hypothetical protein GZ78_00905 [Endozoicomonas numazuensis]|uniref:Uncharacterized protein n=1 Tax=Endozoicomonas numazuensis TaxID=1137799 RepID=A0A081NJT5_9GAMM|nr:hypothetical protein GZ78_00905 [Endozoicomonas numazuensis]